MNIKKLISISVLALSCGAAAAHDSQYTWQMVPSMPSTRTFTLQLDVRQTGRFLDLVGILSNFPGASDMVVSGSCRRVALAESDQGVVNAHHACTLQYVHGTIRLTLQDDWSGTYDIWPLPLFTIDRAGVLELMP